MKEYELKDTDPEDIEDLLFRIESLFNIKFTSDELVYIINFGELCDHIVNKIQLEDLEDCSSQQAFYKLRDSISTTLQIDRRAVSTDTPLTDLLPPEDRRSIIEKLETNLGFKLNILRPPYWVTGSLIVLFFTSIIALPFKWQIGVTGLIVSIAGFWISHTFAKKLKLQTVGQVAEKMTRENYLKARRNSNTFNKKEIEKVLTDLFCEELSLDKSKLTRDAKF